MSKIRTIPQSFGYAFEGIKTAIKNEPNFRIHLLAGTLAIVAAILLRFTSNEWLILISTISFVLILELINTSLEAIVDLVSPQRQAKAKIAKDVAAAAVLIASVLAITVGLTLFLPKLSQL